MQAMRSPLYSLCQVGSCLRVLGAISEEVPIPGDFNGDFVMFCPLPDLSVGLEPLGVGGVPILFSRTQASISTFV